MRVKTKTSRALFVLSVVSFMLLLGTFGALELGNISLLRGVVQAAIGQLGLWVFPLLAARR